MEPLNRDTIKDYLIQKKSFLKTRFSTLSTSMRRSRILKAMST